MSQEVSKLRAAFTGAAKEISKPKNLIVDAAVVGLLTVFTIATGGAALPTLAWSAAGCLSYDGLKGAYKALR